MLTVNKYDLIITQRLIAQRLLVTLLPLLFVILLVVSSVISLPIVAYASDEFSNSGANIGINIEATVTATQEESINSEFNSSVPLVIQDSNIDTNSDEYIAQQADNKKALLEALEHDEFVVTKEVKNWQLIDEVIQQDKILTKKKDTDKESWWEIVLEKLFNTSYNEASAGSIGSFFALLLKLLFVVALVVLIYWVVKNSDSLIALMREKKWQAPQRTTHIDEYREAHLAQGWETLPHHNDIPRVVQQLLEENRHLPAASILYRGSLRWLNTHTHIRINPTDTERSCMKVLQDVRQHQLSHIDHTDKVSGNNNHNNNHNNKHRTLTPATQSYIIDVIQLWLPIGYNTHHITTENRTQCTKQLQQMAERWLMAFNPENRVEEVHNEHE